MIDVNKISLLMAQKGIAQTSELIGVSAKECQALERFFDLRFPLSYRKFLQHCGRSAGLLSPWMAIYFDDLKEIRELFEQVNATRKTPFELPSQALLIANKESCFDFINCNEGDDPVVYRIDLDSHHRAAAVHAESYSEYLENLVSSSDVSSAPSELAIDEALMPMEDVIHY